MKEVVIGLDLGTSSVKAAGFDRHGALLCKASAPIATYSPHPGWVEQEPTDWWNAACLVLNELVKVIPADRIAAIGLAGQCPTHVCVGADGKPIGRALLWQDQRAVKEAAWITNHVTPTQTEKWTGSSSIGDATCPPARLLWLRDHRPEEWAKTAAVVQPKDFIAIQLTGCLATDRHSAFCLFNLETRRYEPDYFAAVDIPLVKMPPALSPVDVVGNITASACKQTGLEEGIPVVIGTIDAYCDNLAGGICDSGRAVDVAGTSEIISLNVDRKVSAEGVFPAELDGNIFLCGPTQAGADTLRWLFAAFYQDCGITLDYEKMEQEAGEASPGCDGLVFLPYLNGERAPLWDPQARAAFLGLTNCHDRRHFTRAVYESIGYAIRHILEAAENAAGRKAEEIVVCGGGSRSRFWNQVKADILQRPVRPAAVTETGCLGAAILAGVGIGFFPGLKKACKEMIQFKATLVPNDSLQDVYEARYRLYRGCYPALRSVITANAPAVIGEP